MIIGGTSDRDLSNNMILLSAFRAYLSWWSIRLAEEPFIIPPKAALEV